MIAVDSQRGAKMVRVRSSQKFFYRGRGFRTLPVLCFDHLFKALAKNKHLGTLVSRRRGCRLPRPKKWLFSHSELDDSHRHPSSLRALGRSSFRLAKPRFCPPPVPAALPLTAELSQQPKGTILSLSESFQRNRRLG